MNKIKQIILIDDDDTINFLNKIIIRQSGCCEDVKIFQDAQEGLNFIAEEKKNKRNESCLLLLDINMPKMDGWDFMRQYEALGFSDNKTVIIMLTSSINPNDRNKAKTFDSINDFTTKPLTVEILERVTKKYF